MLAQIRSSSNHIHTRLSHIITSHLVLRYSTTQTLTTPNPKTSKFLVYCNSQIANNGRAGNLKEAESIFNRMPNKNIVSWTAMLTAYAQNGQINKARAVFDEMPERNIVSWNAMITAYMRMGNGIHEASQLFSSMPARNAVSYASMLTTFVNGGRFSEAEKLYAETSPNWRDPVCSNALINGYLKVGRLEEAIRIFESMVKRDVVSWSSMVDGYCRQERVDDARQLFDDMPEKNFITWSSMINGYMKMGRFDDGFGLFLQMRRENLVKIEFNTLTIVLEACGTLGKFIEGCQIHGLVLRMGFKSDLFLANSVIIMYSRFGCVDLANTMFCSMNVRDLVSWNSLISGFIQAKRIDDACKLFDKFPEKDVISWTTMISGLSSNGLMEKSIELFEKMPEKDDISWNALISGFVNNSEYEKAILLFIKMLKAASASIRSNPLTLSSVLTASSGLGTLKEGLQLHTHVIKTKMEFDLSIQNSLVSMYSKCGSVGDAYRIFKSIENPNIVSFNSMIGGFAQNGCGKEAIKLFKKMQNEGHEPNDVTFLCVLSACSHTGFVQEGLNFFESMKSYYKIDPGPDHYACMVDLLGRAGLLDEAFDLIKSMPFEPHLGVWGSLLGSSRIHLRVDLAKIAAKSIYGLDPNNSAPFVVLSDIYAVSGRKEEEEEVRRAKRLRGVRKSPGCSWITVGNKVCLFLSGDESHVKIEEIKGVLLVIMSDIRQLDCERQQLCLQRLVLR